MMHFFISLCVIANMHLCMLEKPFFFLCGNASWHVCECGCVLFCFINTFDLCVCVSACLCVLWRAEPTRQTTTKRRKRKNSASSASNSSLGNSAGGKKRSPANNFNLTSQVPVSIKSSSLHTHIVTKTLKQFCSECCPKDMIMLSKHILRGTVVLIHSDGCLTRAYSIESL